MTSAGLSPPTEPNRERSIYSSGGSGRDTSVHDSPSVSGSGTSVHDSSPASLSKSADKVGSNHSTVVHTALNSLDSTTLHLNS